MFTTFLPYLFFYKHLHILCVLCNVYSLSVNEHFYSNYTVTVKTAMLKRLRFLFKAHRVQSDPGKFPRYDIYYGCINGKTVEPTSHYSTQTSKRAAQVVFVCN